MVFEVQVIFDDAVVHDGELAALACLRVRVDVARRAVRRPARVPDAGRAGAQRIGTTGYTAENLTYMAFRNTDGSYAMIALNRNSEPKTIAVQGPDKAFRYDVPAQSIASFRWSDK